MMVREVPLQLSGPVPESVLLGTELLGGSAGPEAPAERRSQAGCGEAGPGEGAEPAGRGPSHRGARGRRVGVHDDSPGRAPSASRRPPLPGEEARRQEARREEAGDPTAGRVARSTRGPTGPGPRRSLAPQAGGRVLLRARLRFRESRSPRAGRDLRPGGRASRRAARGSRRGLGAPRPRSRRAQVGARGTGSWGTAGGSRYAKARGASSSGVACAPRACAS